jgi:gamma-glutamylcyclotransferase (GGCT)/AIG2-like uncharacterized protein YtfP
VHWLFVYGTLMPGRLRWPRVAGEVAERRPASVPGTLYDTGRGYPALLLAPEGAAGGDGLVHGWLLGFPDERADAVMARLDEVEGPSYVRAGVTATDGTGAVTYAWGGRVPDGFTALAGRWESVEER